MNIRKTVRNYTLEQPIPQIFQQRILHTAQRKRKVPEAARRLVGILTALGDKASIRPGFLGNKLSLDLYDSPSATKGSPLIEKIIDPTMSSPKRKETLYKMFMALTPGGVKEVVEKMHPKDYLPFF